MALTGKISGTLSYPQAMAFCWETDGPVTWHCPERTLRQLTPTDVRCACEQARDQEPVSIPQGRLGADRRPAVPADGPDSDASDDVRVRVAAVPFVWAELISALSGLYRRPR